MSSKQNLHKRARQNVVLETSAQVKVVSHVIRSDGEMQSSVTWKLAKDVCKLRGSMDQNRATFLLRDGATMTRPAVRKNTREESV